MAFGPGATAAGASVLAAGVGVSETGEGVDPAAGDGAGADDVGTAVSAGIGPCGRAPADHAAPKTKNKTTAPSVTMAAARGSEVRREKREGMARL